MAANQVPNLKLNNGHLMSQLGLGTWQGKEGEVTAAVIDAIEAGYRHTDGAPIYRNEPEVGAGIQAKIDDGTLKRHLKHWPMALQPGGDLIPVDNDGNWLIDNETDLAETWKEVEKLVGLGLTKSIGVSNFNKRQIDDIRKIATIPPATNQIEMHPYLTQSKLVEYCNSKGITVTAFSPFCFGDKKFLEEPNLVKIGEKYGKGARHVILRWLLQKGFITIPKSVNKGRIIDNINILDFTLTVDDIKQVESLDKGWDGRINLELMAKNSKDYPFDEEF